jgi:hypothetical protein
MREVVFVSMPGVGPGVGPSRKGSLVDLVVAIPYLVMSEIPPRRVLNDVLTRGFSDAGMSGGCIWEPLEIDETEYSNLVEALQRRGRRPVEGRDSGGKPFDVPQTPDAILTHGEWVVFRAERRGAINPLAARRLLEDEDTLHPLEGRYERWLDWLPVGELYLAQLRVRHPDWEDQPDSSLELPVDLVQLLRRLHHSHQEWLHRDQRSDYAASIPEELARGQDADAIRHEIREFVDRNGLPRWPHHQM